MELDRSSWRRVKFVDVASNVNEYFSPERDGVLPFVAGPHIDADSAVVQRFGLTNDDTFPPTFKRMFRPGDVLLHSRNIEKAAVVDVRGVTGEKLFVLRTKDPSVLDQAFLLWLVRNGQVRRVLEENFTGSVNKFVNWTPLAAAQFDLPPLDEQRRIANLLSVLDRSLALEDAKLRAIDQVLEGFCADVYLEALEAGTTYPIPDVAEIRMGRQKAPKYMNGVSPRPYLCVTNVGHLELDTRDLPVMDFSEAELETYRLLPGDIVLTEGDLMNSSNVGRPALYEHASQECCFQNTLIRFRPKTALVPLFALAVLEGMRLHGVFAQAATATTVTHLGLRRFSGLRMPLLSPARQSAVASALHELLQTRKLVRAARADTLGVASTLRGGLFA